MSTHTNHPENDAFYFITFTCYRWINLFDITQIYDYLHFWLDKLKLNGCILSGYVIMPNHMHLLIYVEPGVTQLNKIIGESKRFLAYAIIKRLKSGKKVNLLRILRKGVQQNESLKGKRHQVFRLSFDGKLIENEKVPFVLDYIHRNPVTGKWNLVDDYTDFKYSSAGFYEKGADSFYEISDFRKIRSNTAQSPPSK